MARDDQPPLMGKREGHLLPAGVRRHGSRKGGTPALSEVLMSRARWMSEHMQLSTHVETDTDRAAVGGKRVKDGAAVPLGTSCATFRERPPGSLADVAALAARSRLHSPITEAPTRTGNPTATPAASGLLRASGDIMRLSVPTCEMGQGHITERVSRKGEHFLAWDSHRASPPHLPQHHPDPGDPYRACPRFPVW